MTQQKIIDKMTQQNVYTKSELQSLSIEEQTSLFDDLLRKTNRQNIENLISWLHGTDFYTSPASTNGVSNYSGGLLYHSLSVYNILLGLYESLSKFDEGNNKDEFDDNSIILVSLLHDICLMQSFVPVEKRKMVGGAWVTVSSYDYYDQFPIGHGEKSLLFISMNGVYLSREEMLAIRWHGGPNSLSESELPTYYSALKSSKLTRLLVTSIDLCRSYMEENREFEIKR